MNHGGRERDSFQTEHDVYSYACAYIRTYAYMNISTQGMSAVTDDMSLCIFHLYFYSIMGGLAAMIGGTSAF